jgi:F-type H+-transporting ATPase subunit a
MAHDPISHVIDEIGRISLFHELTEEFFGREVFIPLLDLTPYNIPFTMTKFMVLELVAAGLIIAIFVPLARRAASGAAPRGAWWNAFEGLLTFIRDQVAKPPPKPPAPNQHHQPPGHDDHHTTAKQEPVGELAPGAHIPDDADRYVPFLWTIFLFILFCNLLGMVPFGGSPTASIYVTGALALCSFVMFHAGAIFKMGPANYVKSYWPSAEIPFGMGYLLKPMIFLIEILGTVIKGGVLAVRLFANLFAGHLVLANLLFFITMAANSGPLIWGGVTVASVLGVFALSLLELFVAFLQAFIFTFLTALFMGMAMNPQH